MGSFEKNIVAFLTGLAIGCLIAMQLSRADWECAEVEIVEGKAQCIAYQLKEDK